MAVNALLYTWMDGDRLSPDVPFEVKTVIVRASKWLMKYAKRLPAKNVFFSMPIHNTDVSETCPLLVITIVIFVFLPAGYSFFISLQCCHTDEWDCAVRR